MYLCPRQVMRRESLGGENKKKERKRQREKKEKVSRVKPVSCPTLPSKCLQDFLTPFFRRKETFLLRYLTTFFSFSLEVSVLFPSVSFSLLRRYQSHYVVNTKTMTGIASCCFSLIPFLSFKRQSFLSNL